MSYLHVKWNSFGLWFARQRFKYKSISCLSLATPGTGAYDAIGGVFRPKCKEWPGRLVPFSSSFACVLGSRLQTIFSMFGTPLRRGSVATFFWVPILPH